MGTRFGLAARSLLAALAAATLVACRSLAATPEITQVRPGTAAPGGFVLVSGRGFDRAAVVWLDGRPAASVTWLNAELLTAVLPEGLAPGAYPLEVRSLDGRRAAVSVNVGPPPAPAPTPPVTEATPRPQAAPAPPAVAPAPPPAPVPPSVAAPPPVAPVSAAGAATEGERRAAERAREGQKKAEERLREQQQKADERRREADERREEAEKERR